MSQLATVYIKKLWLSISPSLQLSETSSIAPLDMDKYSGICECNARVLQHRGFNEAVIPSTTAN